MGRKCDVDFPFLELMMINPMDMVHGVLFHECGGILVMKGHMILENAKHTTFLVSLMT